MKRLWKIPVTWESYGVVEIEAETLEEALEITETDPYIELPDGDYIEGSWKVEPYEVAEHMNKNRG